VRELFPRFFKENMAYFPGMKKKRFKIETLGCRTNQYESQAFADQLTGVGFSEAHEGEQADLCIINTCTVTDSADKRSLYQIRKLEREHPGAPIYVTGCMAERRASEILKLSPQARVIPNKEKETLLTYALPDETLPEFSIKRFEAHTRAFVKVQDGCNSFCSYCIIPYVRGRSRSKPIDLVLKEIHDLVDNGFKEVVLTGINIGDYEDGLANLVRAVDKIDGIERIRISSIDPDEVDDDLLDAVISGKKTCPSMHIVLQAGSNKVLKRMNRKYTREDFFHTTERLVAANPDFTFTTDIIVGFPGETEEDFQDTLDAMKEVRFAKVHMFPFSVRPGTRAARFTDFVAEEVKAERKQTLMRLSERIGYNLREQYIGKTMKVLVEDNNTGHTENFLSVTISDQDVLQNQIYDVEIVENSPEGLRGVVCQYASL